jgi:hypothetical protein
VTVGRVFLIQVPSRHEKPSHTLWPGLLAVSRLSSVVHRGLRPRSSDDSRGKRGRQRVMAIAGRRG